jgi:hypothetical protein
MNFLDQKDFLQSLKKGRRKPKILKKDLFASLIRKLNMELLKKSKRNLNQKMNLCLNQNISEIKIKIIVQILRETEKSLFLNCKL